MYLAALREVVVGPPASVAPARYERERATLPAPVKKAVAAVAIGTALQVGMSLTGKYLARQAAKQAVGAVRGRGSAKPGRPRVREVTPPEEQEPNEYAGAAAVSETVLIRRVWIRRP